MQSILAHLKDHEETLKPDQRQAKILQGPVSQIIKTQKLEKPRIDLIAQLLGQTVRQALRYHPYIAWALKGGRRGKVMGSKQFQFLLTFIIKIMKT